MSGDTPTTSFDVNKMAIPIFNGSNWIDFSTCLELITRYKKIWTYISGEAVLADDAVDKAVSKFNQEKEAARLTLLFTLDVHFRQHYKDTKDPADIWSDLKEQFTTTSYAHVFNLHNQL